MEISAREWNELKAAVLEIKEKVTTLAVATEKKMITPKEVCEMILIIFV